MERQKALGHGACLAALALSLLHAAPVLAQTSSTQAPQDASDTVDTETADTESGDTGTGEKGTGDASDTLSDQAIREIIVTGTNISGVKNVGSETFSFSRDEVLATGKSTVEEVLRTLPQIQTVSGGNAQGTPNAGGTSRGNALNLRGLGQGATLTLVDGHRISPSGTNAAFTEANQVPLAAIERIDVIADGASAVYGSDAIAGVVNYVLRKDFEGLEASSRYTAGAYGNDEWALSLTGGATWEWGGGNSGNILFSYEHSKRLPYLQGRNPRLREDQRAYGGIDNRIEFASGAYASFPAGSPALAGNVLVRTADGSVNSAFPQGGSFIYYALPDNPTGAALTASDLRVVDVNCTDSSVCTDYPNVADDSDYTDYLGRQVRDQFAIFLNQDIGSVSFYDEFFYTKSKQTTRAGMHGNGNGTAIVRVTPDNPNYISGITDGNLVVQLNLTERGIKFVNDNPDENFNNTFGARTGLFKDWVGEAYYTFGQDKTCGVCYFDTFVSYESNAAATLWGEPILGLGLQNALQNAVDSGLINPFSTAPFSEEALDYILGTNSQFSQNYSHDVVLKFDGTLLTLPGGDAKAAIGSEYYFGIQKLQNGANRPPDEGSVFTPDADARTSRHQYAVFGEVYLPLVGYDMGVPLMREFIVNAAMRYDHYSDFGSTTNPKVSAIWTVNDDLQLRGSFGTSFRAPGLPELNGGVFSLGIGFSNTAVDGITGVPQTCSDGVCTINTLYLYGNNPNLKAERGTNWQLGFDYTPSYVPGLKFTATYYNIHYKNKMGVSSVPANPFTSLETYNQYQGLVIPITAPGDCDNSDPSTYDPALLPYYDFLYATAVTSDPRDYCSLQAVVDGRTVSAAEAFQDGLDVNLNYMRTFDVGTIGLGVNLAKIFTSTQVTTEGGPEVDILDTITNPISLRLRGNLSFQRGPFSATLFGNYVGGYRNNQPISIEGVVQDESQVPGWTTFDLSLSLAFPQTSAPWRALRGTRFAVNVSNLFNNDPPVVLSSVLGTSTIDTYAHNALGRFVQFQITKTF